MGKYLDYNGLSYLWDKIKLYLSSALSTKVDKVSSTDNAAVRFNGEQGAILNSGVIIDDNNNVTAAKFITNNGTASQVVLGTGALQAANTLPQYEAYLLWGGKNFSGSYGPIDAALVEDLGANRFLFLKADGITVEYSRDSGATWTDYGLSDSNKVALFSLGYNIVCGKNSAGTAVSSAFLVRVTIDTYASWIYTTLNKFIIYISSNGGSSCWCTITGRTQTNYTNNSNTWATFVNKAGISGWSGYNIINYNNGITTCGNPDSAATLYRLLRFTFGQDGGSSTTYAGLSILSIKGYGGVGWRTPSTMAKTGHLYSYDEAQNATFPANVTASKIIKSGGTSSQFLKADGSIDTNTYLTQATFNSGNPDLKAIEALTGTSGFLTKTAANTWALDTNTYLTALTLPTAASSTLGGIKTGYTTSGNNRAVLVDSNGNAYVTLKDDNTTYTFAGGTNGRFTVTPSGGSAQTVAATKSFGDSIEYIVGTQASATNAWTGVTQEATLASGKIIAYKLPVAGNSSNATLNLTLSGGGTTGAIGIRRKGTGGVTTHYSAGEVIFMAYDGTYWQVNADYDSNSNDTTTTYARYNHGAYAPTTALYDYELLFTHPSDTSKLIPANTTDGSVATTKTTITTEKFNPFDYIYYYNTTTTVAANTNVGVSYIWYAYSLIDLRYSFNTGTTLTANKDVYLVVKMLGDGTAKLRNPGATDSNASALATGTNAGPISQILPTSDDGYVYIRLGHSYDTYRIALTFDHPMYIYKGGSVQRYNEFHEGGDTTGTFYKAVTAASNNTPFLSLSSANLDAWIWRVKDNATGTKTSTDKAYGFGLKYLGSGESNNNALALYADNLSGTLILAMKMLQDGTITLSSAPKVNGGTAAGFLKANGTIDTTSYAPLASPSFSGTPTAPTAAADTNSTQIATTAFVKSAVDGKVHYVANLQAGTAANYITEPEVKTVKINGSTTNSASTTNCVLQFDTTNQCLKFVFN